MDQNKFLFGSRNLPCILTVGYYLVLSTTINLLKRGNCSILLFKISSFDHFSESRFLIWSSFIYFNLVSLNYWHYYVTLTSTVIKLLDTNYTKSFHVDDFLLDTIKELFNIRIKSSLGGAFIHHHQLCSESQLLFFLHKSSWILSSAVGLRVQSECFEARGCSSRRISSQLETRRHFYQVNTGVIEAN